MDAPDELFALPLLGIRREQEDHWCRCVSPLLTWFRLQSGYVNTPPRRLRWLCLRIARFPTLFSRYRMGLT